MNIKKYKTAIIIFLITAGQVFGPVGGPVSAFALNRYWIGGTGNWSINGNWSNSSGGASCGCTPGSSDTAILDGASGTGTATLSQDVSITALDMQSGNDVDIDTSASDYSFDTSGDFTVAAGTFTANGSTITVSGGWSTSVGNFTEGTSSVVLDGTGTLDSTGDTFYNLTVGNGASSETTTITSDLTVGNVLTIVDSGDTLTDAAGGYNITVTGTGTPFVNNSSAVIANQFIYFDTTGATVNAAGGIYNVTDKVSFEGGHIANTTYQLNGHLTVNGDIFVSGTNAVLRSVTLNTTATPYNITADNLTVGTDSLRTGKLIANGSTVDINGNVILTYGMGSVAIDANTSNWTVSGNLTNIAAAFFDSDTSSITFDSSSSDQTVTTDGRFFYDLTLNNTAASGSDDIIISGALDVNGTLTITDGDLDISTNDPTINTAGNVSIAANGSIDVSSRTANWTFDGSSTLTDSSSTGPQDLEDVVLNGTSLTLGSDAKVQTMTVTSGILNLGSSNYTLEMDGTGTPLSNAGTFTAGTSTVKYTGTTTATNITVVPYSSLQLTPTGATTYSLIGETTLTGDLTIDTNATLDSTVANNYNLSTRDVLINGTFTPQGSTVTVSGDWEHTNGTFTMGTSTIDFTGTGTIKNDVASWWNPPFYNINAAAGGQTTTIFASKGITVKNICTLGTGTVTGGQLILDLSSGTPLVTSGATIGSLIKYGGSTGPVNVAATDYASLWFAGNSAINTFNLAGNITCTALQVNGNATNGLAILDTTTNNYSITASWILRVGASGDTSKYGTLKLNNSSIDLNRDVFIYASDGSGTNSIVAGASTINVAGGWTNGDVFTAGTSTVTFDATSGTANISTGGIGADQDFWDLKFDDAGGTATYTLAGDIDVDGDLTITGGTFDVSAANYTVTVAGTWTNSDTFVDRSGTVIFDATSGTSLINPGGTGTNQDFWDIEFNDAGGSATYKLSGDIDVNNDLTIADGVLDTNTVSDYAVNVTNDLTMTGGMFAGNASTITVSGNLALNGTEDNTQLDNSSVVLDGTGSLSYSSLVSASASGVNNLTVGQSGNTTTMSSTFAIYGTLTIGSGTYTGTEVHYLRGDPDPLSFDSNSTVSIKQLRFFGSNQNIPTLMNGYDSDIRVSRGTNVLTQTGTVTINGTNDLILDGDTFASREVTYDTAGFDLVVGGDIIIGSTNNDTALKTLNGTNNSITVGGNFDIKSVGSGSAQATFTSTGSTVTFNGTALQTVTMNGSNFNNLTITNASASGVSFADAFTAVDFTDITAGSKLTLKAGSTYTISGTLTLTGSISNEITLLSDSGGTRFTFDVTGGDQGVNYVNVTDSEASSNNISARSSTSASNNDEGEAPPHWLFSTRGAMMLVE